MKINIFTRKRKGMALLGLVLISLIVLGIYTTSIFIVSTKTLSIEVWQSKHTENTRLSYLARSSANAVIEAISDDVALFVTGKFPIDKHSTTVISGIEPTTVDIIISGDKYPNLIVKAKATNDKNQQSEVSLRYNVNTNKSTGWENAK